MAIILCEFGNSPYLLIYSRNKSLFQPLKRPKDIRGRIVTRSGIEYWIEEDWLRKEFGKYGTCRYEEIEQHFGPDKKQDIDKGIEQGLYELIKKKPGITIVGRLRRIDTDGSKFYSIVKHLNANGVEELEELGLSDAFPFPKPISLLKQLILGITFTSRQNSDVILDIVAGSGTTAHAVLDLNAVDGGDRKFILVQLPEPTDREDYPTIAEITKERVRRVIKKLDEADAGKEAELFDGADDKSPQDRGFRVFKLDESNFTPWDATAPKDAESLATQLEMHVEHVKAGRSAPDILYELLLKSGFSLTVAIDELDLSGKKVFSVAEGTMLICLENELTLELIREMAELAPHR